MLRIVYVYTVNVSLWGNISQLFKVLQSPSYFQNLFPYWMVVQPHIYRLFLAPLYKLQGVEFSKNAN